MSYQAITKFFMWNTIINVGILILWSLVFFTASDVIYEIHGKFFSLSRENFNSIIYGLIGLFKILVFVFNVIPFFALLILKKKNGSERLQ